MMLLTFLIITDINECLNNNGRCSHTCNNTVGSYHCKCPTGYVLQSNNHNCAGTVSTFNCSCTLCMGVTLSCNVTKLAVNSAL